MAISHKITHIKAHVKCETGNEFKISAKPFEIADDS